MRSIIAICSIALAGSACADQPKAKPVASEIMDRVISESRSLYGDGLSFTNVYQSKGAVCGTVTKDGKEQQFIYVRNRFLLQERSPSGEWEAQWFTECDNNL